MRKKRRDLKTNRPLGKKMTVRPNRAKITTPVNPNFIFTTIFWRRNPFGAATHQPSPATMVIETAAAAPADDPDIAAGNHPVAAAPRVSSYIAKLGVTTPEELQEQYPGCAKLSGTPHALMDPNQELWFVCKRCSSLYTPGGFEAHCNVRQSKKNQWCETKHKDRSLKEHDLEEDEGHPEKETQTFWKGMYSRVDRENDLFQDESNVYFQARGSVGAYVVAPTGNLRVICIPCMKSLSLNKVKQHIQQAHTCMEYSDLRLLEPINRAGKFFCCSFALNKDLKHTFFCFRYQIF